MVHALLNRKAQQGLAVAIGKIYYVDKTKSYLIISPCLSEGCLLAWYLLSFFANK
jgi:hypothetical protein